MIRHEPEAASAVSSVLFWIAVVGALALGVVWAALGPIG